MKFKIVKHKNITNRKYVWHEGVCLGYYTIQIKENKNIDKDTTSDKFKEDILRIFGNGYKDKTLLELGCHQGNTTRVYAECFNKVIAVERDESNLMKTKEICKDVDNVEFICSDVYDKDFQLQFDNPLFKDVPKESISRGESLEDTVIRVKQFYNQIIIHFFYIDFPAI